MVYRYPEETKVNAVFQEDTSVQQFTDFDTTGFVFAPFDDKGQKILISGDVLNEEIQSDIVADNGKSIDFSNQGKEHHIQLVKKAVQQIQAGGLDKVVLSRKLNLSTSKEPFKIAHALLVKYPNAFVYWWYHPKVGMWFGATPERLLNYRKGKISTTSLAGTLPVTLHTPNWTPKEREEQAMVTDFITSNLEDYVDNLNVSKPENKKAGKLWHLKSEIKGNLKSGIDLSKITEKLHPTPAVCGLPKQEAFDFINANEGYNREFYTGYLGTVNMDSAEVVNLFVNLRCFKYSNGNAQIFVGGGITGSSDPEKEWEETQFKSSTILEVL